MSERVAESSKRAAGGGVHGLLDRVHATWWGHFYRRLIELRLLDQIYQVSASVFVAYIPLILVLAAIFTGGQTAIAQSIIGRFGLTGGSAQTVRELMDRQAQGVYWLGLVIVLWSAISVGRKLSRTYTDMWSVPRLRLHQQWRAVVWLAIQVAMSISVAYLRELWGPAGAARFMAFAVVTLAVWLVAETAGQYVLTGGQVPVRSLVVAAGVVTVGRVGLALWSVLYLADSLASQALNYGPIGVVFSMFTYIVATVGVLLLGTLLAVTWLERGHPGREPDAAAPSGGGDLATA